MADMEDMYSNTRYVSNVSSNLDCTLHRARYVLGVGTSMADMEDMYSNTRYVSNVSSNLDCTLHRARYVLGV